MYIYIDQLNEIDIEGPLLLAMEKFDQNVNVLLIALLASHFSHCNKTPIMRKH